MRQHRRPVNETRIDSPVEPKRMKKRVDDQHAIVLPHTQLACIVTKATNNWTLFDHHAFRDASRARGEHN